MYSNFKINTEIIHSNVLFQYINKIDFIMIYVLVKGCLSEDTIQTFLRQLGKLFTITQLHN